MEVLSETRNHVAILTLNRPAALNALSLGMIVELRRVFDACAADGDVRAVIIKGAGGKAFNFNKRNVNEKTPMQLKELHAVISGGASGLGLAVANRIVLAGGKVTLLDVNEAQGAAAATTLGNSAAFIATDVTDESAVNDAVDRARQGMGSINAAVNCAGIATPTRLVGKQGAMAGAFFRKMIEINLVGTVLVSKAAAVAMQQNAPNPAGERGVIVMTASVAAFDGQIGQVAYAASKGGIVAMTLPMARELASSGIRVMTIAPGLFATPMMKGLPQEAQDSLGKQTPFPPRLGEPDEYAAMVAHIMENTMLNGESIRLDGAIRMQPR